ncbi:MAG TPA: hypothetical protein VL137_06330 [Polyangiaceae bacterium]|nr:hypothetical protein [Polyangiaceae bacterium]
MKLVVIGGGAAGSAAAWQAATGREVTVVHSTAGATELMCGALDWDAWGAPVAKQGTPEVLRFLTDLGCWNFGPALVATSTGQMRWAAASDHALLNINALAGGVVAVTDLGRLGCDAQGAANALNASSWAKQTHTRFECVPDIVPEPRAARANDYDFASLHDDEAAAHALGDTLAGAGGKVQGWLLPPALGVSRAVRPSLEQRVGAKVGEWMSMPGGPCGARFQIARDHLFKARGIASLHGRVSKVQPGESGGFRIHCVDLEGNGHILETDQVILACGGLIAGGVQMGEARSMAASEAAFSLSVGIDVPMAVGGARLTQVASLHGFDVQQNKIAALEHVGLLANEGIVAECSGLFAAGEVIAGAPRSALAAVESGLTAARKALAVSE